MQRVVASSGLAAGSGSGVAELGHNLVMELLGNQPVLDFSCEIEKAKQQFLANIVHSHMQSGASFCMETLIISKGRG